MPKPLHLLIVEDVESDAALIIRMIEKGGYQIVSERVESEESMRTALARQDWNAVISDYRMPNFSADSALSLFRQADLDIPFIVVSGSIGEDTAVCMMKAGVHDYILKSNLTRLVPAMERELRDAEMRRDKKRSDETLRRERNLMRTLMDNFPDHIYFKDRDSRFIQINGSQAERFGLGNPSQAAGMTDFDFFSEEHASAAIEDERMIMRTGQPILNLEEKETWPDGSETWVSTTKMPLRDENGGIIGTFGVSRDITERRKMEDRINADLNEKKILLKEVHHRVKNNMQVIISLLNLQAARIEDPGVLALFNQSQNRIFSMALIHEMLYSSENISKVNFSNYLSRLAKQLLEVYGKEPPHVDIDIEPGTLELGIDQAVPCGLIVQEIVSNSFKHAFPNGWKGSPKIRIGLASNQNMFELTVGDNGIGLPDAHHLEKSRSLGMTLINLLGNDQLGGEIRIDPHRKGTNYIICFKVV
jgi:PAS domain S-box-containing protein